MPNAKLGGVLIVSLLLSGCSAIQKFEHNAAFSVGAEPLAVDETLALDWTKFSGSLPPSVLATTTPKKNYLGFMASTSQTRCAFFLAGLVEASNGTHTGFDMITTVFSALGTAFTPLSLVHAMTAGATISSGWKTAIDTDVFAKQTANNLVQAIQNTYYKDIGNYVDALAAKSESDIVLAAEITKIQTIHGECTLASAEGTVLATLSTSGQPSGTLSEVMTVSVSGANGANRDTLTVAVQSTTIPGIPLISVPVTSGETAAQIATDLMNHINAIVPLTHVGVSAATGSDPASIVVSWPSSAGLTWTPKIRASSLVTVTATQPVSADTQAGQPGKPVTR